MRQRSEIMENLARLIQFVSVFLLLLSISFSLPKIVDRLDKIIEKLEVNETK